MTPDARFETILENMVMLGVTRSGMFGRRSLMADGQVIAVFLDDAMTFRLGVDSVQHAKALALDGAELWHPADKAMAFKDWVRVPVSESDHWANLAEEALHRIRQKL